MSAPVLTPYAFGATSATSADDNTVPIAAMFAAAAASTSPMVYFPPGDWRALSRHWNEQQTG